MPPLLSSPCLQFYDDVMAHGHPHTYDDSILESGNRRAKNFKKILFFGGSDEADAKVEQQRSTGKRDADGELIFRTVTKPAAASEVVQLMQVTYQNQALQQRRGAGLEQRSEAAEAYQVLKHEQFDAACVATERSLEKLEAAVVTGA